MNYKRGLFRLWVVLTVAALVAFPAWAITMLWDEASNTCFDIVEIEWADDAPLSATQAVSNDDAYCPRLSTHETTALLIYWSKIKRLRVRYEFDDTSKIVTAIPGNFDSIVALQMAANAGNRRAVILPKLTSTIPIIEVTLVLMAVASWWVLRLLLWVGGWIRRGSRA